MKAVILCLILTIAASGNVLNSLSGLDDLEKEIEAAMSTSDALDQMDEDGNGKKDIMQRIIDIDLEAGESNTEVDMKLGPKQNQEFNAGAQGDLIQETSNHWDGVGTENGKKIIIVPYVYDLDQSSSEARAAIEGAFQQAIDEYTSKTCIRFTPKTNQGMYIRVINDGGCYSYVGKMPQIQQFINGQELSLQYINRRSGCHFKGIAIHEMMHAIGYFHEQSRPDRDTYVKVNFENVRTGFEDNFKKAASVDQGTGYDYESVMHYGATAFSKNGGKTIERLDDPNKSLGQRDGLSEIDALSINKIYCDGSTTSTTQSTPTSAVTSTDGTFTTTDGTVTTTDGTVTTTDGTVTTTDGTVTTTDGTVTTTDGTVTTTDGTFTTTDSTVTTTEEISTTTEATTTTTKKPTTGITWPKSRWFCKRATRGGLCRYCVINKHCTATCIDKHRLCPQWAANGFCSDRRYRRYMNSRCRASCTVDCSN